MTKTDLAEQIYAMLNDITKAQAMKYVDKVFELIKQSLANGENVKISGFGSFVTRDKKQRIGRNPQSGEKMVIDSRRVVNFRVSDVLRKSIN